MFRRATTLRLRVKGGTPAPPVPPPTPSSTVGGNMSMLASLRQKMAAKELEDRRERSIMDTLSTSPPSTKSSSSPTKDPTPAPLPLTDSLLPPHLSRHNGSSVESVRHPSYTRNHAHLEEPSSTEQAGSQWRKMKQDAAEREVFRGATFAANKHKPSQPQIGGGSKSYSTIMPQLSITNRGTATSKPSPAEVAKRVLACWVEALRSQGPPPPPSPSVDADGEVLDGDALLKEEAMYMAALELLLSGGPFATATTTAPLSEGEVRMALTLGLIDLECISTALVGVEEEGATTSSSVRDAVLPEDTLEALQMSEHVCKWIREVHASKCSGLPNDQISSLYLRAELAKRDDSNRTRGVVSKTAAAAEVKEFSAEDVALLEEYEKSKTGSSSSSTGGSSSSAAAMLSDTNPVLRRAASLDDGLEESMRVMDRVRQSALLDGDFQEALAYTNAMYERDFQRASDLYSMRSYTDEELRELEIGRQVSGKSLSQESKKELDHRLAAIRKRKADNEQDGEGGDGRDSIREDRNGSSRPAEPWRDARDKHRVSVAKAMRVMNPDSALRPDGGAADMPYFVGPSGGRSFPPPAAAFNVPPPAPTKYGRKAPRYKGNRSGDRVFNE